MLDGMVAVFLNFHTKLKYPNPTHVKSHPTTHNEGEQDAKSKI